MMITIAVADLNQTYCQGLKTMLEQVEGFEVVILSLPELQQEVIRNKAVDILLVDADLYLFGNPGIPDGERVWPVTKTIVLTMEGDEIATLEGSVDAIQKGLGKREFAARIMNLMMEPLPDGTMPAAPPLSESDPRRFHPGIIEYLKG